MLRAGEYLPHGFVCGSFSNMGLLLPAIPCSLARLPDPGSFSLSFFVVTKGPIRRPRADRQLFATQATRRGARPLSARFRQRVPPALSQSRSSKSVFTAGRLQGVEADGLPCAVRPTSTALPRLPASVTVPAFPIRPCGTYESCVDRGMWTWSARIVRRRFKER